MPEILRLRAGTLGDLTKKGKIEVVAPKISEGETAGNFSELRKLFGKDFLGPQEVEATFGVRIAPERVPAVPFTRSELERAKILNQRLVLRVDKAPDGSPLTMAKIQLLLGNRFQRKGQRDVIYDKGWLENEDFFTTDTPRAGWALVSNEPIPSSSSKNYLQQTEVLAAYIQNDVFQGASLPTQFREAAKKFANQRQNLRDLLAGNWQQATPKLTQLKINQFRPKPVEILYDLVMYFQNDGEQLLTHAVIWTNAQARDCPVGAGFFDPAGLHLNLWKPSSALTYVAVCFSRQS